MNPIERIVKASTSAQGIPARLEDASTAARVAVLLDVSNQELSAPQQAARRRDAA